MAKKKFSSKSHFSDMKTFATLKQHHGKIQDYSLNSKGTQTLAQPNVKKFKISFKIQ
jgi:hypothetical protein